MDRLEHFIVNAKKSSYVGNRGHSTPSRQNSHDLRYSEGAYAYLDSYFGGTQFCGQEVVWHDNEPVWAMGYYGFILEPDHLSAEQAAQVIRAALSAMYKVHNRFLGGMAHDHQFGLYLDESDGDYRRFTGVETITCKGVIAYKLNYHGGLILP